MSFLRTLLPRLVLAGVFVALMLLAANPLMKMSIMHTGRSITGTNFSIAHMRSSYSDGYLALQGCVAGHPFRKDHNLFEADSMVFEFDRQALAKRQFLVKSASVDGLRLGTRRATPSFAGEDQVEKYAAQLSDEFAQNGQEWLNRADRQLEQDEQTTFKSVEVAEAMLLRWPREMDALQQRASAVADRVRHLKAELSDAGENPLRNLESYLVAIAEAESLSREMDEIGGQVGRLEQQLMMEQDELSELRDADVQQLAHDVDVLGLNSEELTHYLLGPEVSGWVGEAVSWVHWGRHFLPALGGATHRGSQRGNYVWFPGTEPLAAVQIENMVLRGSLPRGEELVNFEGRVLGLTSSPELDPGETEVIIQTTSETPLLVQAKLAHTAGDAADYVVVNLPSHPQPQRTLGNDQQFAVSVNPTPAHVWMQLRIDGEALSGQMVVKERPTDLSLAIRNRTIGESLSRLIDKALDDVKRIDMEVMLGGTLDHPTWKISSNLGPQLAVSMRTAVEQQLIQRRRSILASQHRVADQQIAQLQGQLTELKAGILAQVEDGANEVAGVKQTIASRVEETDGLIDPNSPLREIFRR